jgi:hypothetical protein
MGRNIKAQVAFEFVLLVAIAFTILIVFVASTRSEFNELSSREERFLLEDVSYMVHNELNLAADMLDGYYREFTLSVLLENGDNYNISIQSDTIIAISENYDYAIGVIHVEGDLIKGVNYINKSGGVVNLNQ